MTSDHNTAEATVLLLEAQLTGAGGPFELVQGSDGTLSFLRGPRTLVELYARAIANGPAPLLLTDRAVHSYDELFERSTHIAFSLPGRCGRVALEATCPRTWVAGMIAVTGSGGAAVLVGDDDRHAAWCIDAGCTALPDVADFLSGDQPAFDAPLPDQEAILSFTSGSTGRPKAIVHTHATILAGLNSMVTLGALATRLAARPAPPMRRPARPVTMLLTPLSHVAGYSAVLLAMMTGGAVAVTDDPTDPERVAQAVHRHRAQGIVGLSRNTFARLVGLPDAERLLGSLRRLQVHGGFLPGAFVDEVRDRFPDLQLMTGYGMSETGGAIASAPVERTAGPATAAGRLSPAVAVRIVDRNGAVLPDGQSGRLQVKGPMLMQGYASIGRDGIDPAGTGPGWFDTGDIARSWPGRWLEVVGRDDPAGTIDDARGLRAIEEAVSSLRGVSDTVALRSASGDIHVFVESADACTDPAAIDEALRKVVPRSTIVLHCFSSFARTGSGKPDRAQLRAMVEGDAPLSDRTGS